MKYWRNFIILLILDLSIVTSSLFIDPKPAGILLFFFFPALGLFFYAFMNTWAPYQKKLMNRRLYFNDPVKLRLSENQQISETQLITGLAALLIATSQTAIGYMIYFMTRA
jgi:hypothetical protein